MTAYRLHELTHLEGRRIHISLIDGSRIDDCELVLVSPFKLWVFVNGRDAFLSIKRVTDVWEAA
jgi:hypothetical protein